MASRISCRRASSCVDVVHVVGGHEAGVVAAPQVDQLLVDRVQLRDVVLLQLQEEAVRAEDLVIPVQLACAPLPGHCPASRRGISADMQPEVQISPSAVPGQEIVVDARVVVEALQLGGAGDLQQVLVAGLVLRQQQQVAGFLVHLGVALLHARGLPGRPPRPMMGLMPAARGGVVEIDHPEHGAVVGDGQGRHAPSPWRAPPAS